MPSEMPDDDIRVVIAVPRTCVKHDRHCLRVVVVGNCRSEIARTYACRMLLPNAQYCQLYSHVATEGDEKIRVREYLFHADEWDYKPDMDWVMANRKAAQRFTNFVMRQWERRHGPWDWGDDS